LSDQSAVEGVGQCRLCYVAGATQTPDGTLQESRVSLQEV